MAEISYVGKSIGVSNLTAFPIISDTPTGTEYGPAIKLSRTLKIQLSPQVATALLESDDSIEDEISLPTGYEITIDASQINDEVRAKLWGHKLDEKGGLTVRSTDTPVPIALAFRSLLSKQSGEDKYAYIVLYKGRLQPFEENFETLKKGQLTFQTHNGIKGTFGARDSDGAILYRMRTDGKTADSAVIGKWFTSPQVAPTTGGIGG